MERKAIKKDTYLVMFKEYPDVVDVEQMSEMIGISTKTAYKLLRENKIKHFKIGRTYKIPKLNILLYINVLWKFILLRHKIVSSQLSWYT